MAIKQYKILRESVSRLATLETAINEYIAYGWQPYGTPTIALIDKQEVYIISMVLKLEENLL